MRTFHEKINVKERNKENLPSWTISFFHCARVRACV